MSGLLKLVELVEKLEAARNLEREEGVKCLKEPSPPAPKQRDAAFVDETATSQPETADSAARLLTSASLANPHRPRGES
jgi:hypothetical protein